MLDEGPIHSVAEGTYPACTCPVGRAPVGERRLVAVRWFVLSEFVGLLPDFERNRLRSRTGGIKRQGPGSVFLAWRRLQVGSMDSAGRLPAGTNGPRTWTGCQASSKAPGDRRRAESGVFGVAEQVLGFIGERRIMSTWTTLRAACICAALGLWGGAVEAQDAAWADKMFDKAKLEFGSVARGADTRAKLTITNKYLEDVHIQSITSSCGCAQVGKPGKDTLKSLESTEFEVTINTRQYTGDRNVGRDCDVRPAVLRPGAYSGARVHSDRRGHRTGGAEFGAIASGAGAEKTLNITYAGRDSWKIVRIDAKNPHVAYKLVETGRGGGRVQYGLTVQIKPEAPVGELRDQLVLHTDDAGNPTIPVLVEAKVEAEYVVNPEVVSFGLVAAGTKKPVNVVIRGRKPFQIEKIESEKTAGAFEVRLPQDARTIHVLPLTFVAPAAGGEVSEMFTVTIAGTGQTVTFRAFAKVNGPAGAAAAAATPAPVTASN